MNGKSILLVDDSALIAEMVGEALRDAGFDITHAKDGYEAIELTYKTVPDLIIMDVDMPLLKGYQASRLLKNRRGVKDIPIIMHTSNSEDKDRFWSYNSGASAFVVKDYNHTESLIKTINKFIIHETPNLATIQEDAKNISREAIAEALSNILDKELFLSTIRNQLANTGSNISSLSGTIMRILEVLDLACERHIAIIILKFDRETIPFIFPTEVINKEMADDLLAVALEDFYSQFDRNSLHLSEAVYFNLEERTDWTKIRLENNKLCSYFHTKISGCSDNVIGTLHIAHLKNNYFSENIVENINVFNQAAGTIIHNAMLFKQVTTMEREIRNVFSKFVPQEIINDLVMRKTQTSMLAGEKRELAILFSDIRSFTTLSETNPPEVVVSFLNKYLETMCEIIIENGGTVDKFIGDAILAVFGAPKSYPDNAKRAVKTALSMSLALEKFDTSGIKLPPCGLDIGIGVHLGDAIVGTIGSSTKFDYTVIGDAVNLASRLEGLSKQYQVRTIISDQVVQQIDANDKENARLKFREIEQVIVKGKEEPTLIYMLEGTAKNSFTETECSLYKKALSMYKLRNWKTASEYFSEVLKTRKDDPVTLMYLERCDEFQINPPPSDWDLVQRYLTK